MVAFMLETFDWDSFTSGLSGESPELASALAKRIGELRRDDTNFLRELLTNDKKVADDLKAILAPDEWYGRLSVEQRIEMDRLVALIFDKPARKVIGAREGGGVDAMLVDYARGKLKIVQVEKKASFRTGGTIREDAKQLQALGERPFRFKKWDPSEAAEANPFLAAGPVHSPPYSIHSPEETAALLGEVEAVDVEAMPERANLRDFESGLLEPLQAAVKTGRALYVWQDF